MLGAKNTLVRLVTVQGIDQGTGWGGNGLEGQGSAYFEAVIAGFCP